MKSHTRGADKIEIVRRLHEGIQQVGIGRYQTALEEGADFDDVVSRLPAPYRDLAALIDPDVVIDARGRGGPLGRGGRWRGRDEWHEFWRDWLDPWEEFDYETSNFEAFGDDVVMDIRLSGRGRESGVPVEWEQTQIWTIRDGRVVGLRPGYETRAEAVVEAKRPGP